MTDPVKVRDVVERIEAASNPFHAAQMILRDIDRDHDFDNADAIIKAILNRVRITSWEVPGTIGHIYYLMGRGELAHAFSAVACHFNPPGPALWHMHNQMFNYLFVARFDDDALEIAMRHLVQFPHAPVAAQHELIGLFERTGSTMAQELRKRGIAIEVPWVEPSPRITHPIHPETIRPFESWRNFGPFVPPCLVPLLADQPRPPVNVVELLDAELLIMNGNVVVCDATGGVDEALSIGHFAPIVANHLRERLRSPEGLETRDADTVVVIADIFGAPNICHFLLDQLTRLGLYQQIGVLQPDTLVVGPRPSAEFQTAGLARLGVQNYLSITETLRVRCRRLLVSTNCTIHFRHPAHCGADWPINFLRREFAVPTVPGTRRLYISRADASARRIVNEGAFMAVAQEAGFESVILTGMTLEQQSSLFMSASHVIGVHGAGLTNIVFCPPGTQVLEMFPPRYGTAAYAFTASGAGLIYSSMVCPDGASESAEFNDPSIPDPSPSRFAIRDVRVDLDIFRAWLRETCG